MVRDAAADNERAQKDYQRDIKKYESEMKKYEKDVRHTSQTYVCLTSCVETPNKKQSTVGASLRQK